LRRSELVERQAAASVRNPPFQSRAFDGLRGALFASRAVAAGSAANFSATQ